MAGRSGGRSSAIELGDMIVIKVIIVRHAHTARRQPIQTTHIRAGAGAHSASYDSDTGYMRCVQRIAMYADLRNLSSLVGS